MERTGANKRVLVIVPCYNEEENIARLASELKHVAIGGCSVQALFINDASGDHTEQELVRAGVTYLDNPVNLGIGGTVQLGFMYAFENGYDIAVQMDGDGQHPPQELSKLVLPVLQHAADVCIGSRFMQGGGFQSTRARRAGIRFFCRLNKLLTGIFIRDTTSGYRAYNREAMKHLIDYYPDEYPEPESIVYLAHKKVRMTEVPVVMYERQGGSSSIGTYVSVYYMMKVTLNILFLHVKLKFND